jgi:hypothetical protein
MLSSEYHRQNSSMPIGVVEMSENGRFHEQSHRLSYWTGRPY